MIFDNCYAPGYIIDDMQFIAACESYNEQLHHQINTQHRVQQSVLVLTFDTEVFPRATRRERDIYPDVLAQIAECLKSKGFGATFCVQLNDSMPASWRSPQVGIRRVLDIMGPDSVGLHGLDHVTKRPGGGPRSYSPEFFREGIDRIGCEYGVTPSYFAQPSWVMTAESALTLRDVPQLRAARGIQSGPTFWKSTVNWNFRFPYIYQGIIYFPYQYQEWNFGDVFGRQLAVDIIGAHEIAAYQSAEMPTLMETIGHPFRFAMGDVARNMRTFEKTLDIYKSEAIQIVSAAEGLRVFESISAPGQVPDWADVLPHLTLRGSSLRSETAGRLPARRTFRNAVIALDDASSKLRRRLSPLKRIIIRPFLV